MLGNYLKKKNPGKNEEDLYRETFLVSIPHIGSGKSTDFIS